MGGGYTQQYIYCTVIVTFVPDYLACGRGGRWIIHNNTSTHKKILKDTATKCYLILTPLFEWLGTRTINNPTNDDYR